MNNYVDVYGRYHDKPCLRDMPSSNNGWIYTAYANKLGLPVDMRKVGRCFNLCRVDSSTLLRSPGKVTPPISRDEILGMVALGVFNPFKGAHLGWNFSPYPIPKFSFIQLCKQLWELTPSSVWDAEKDKYVTVYKHRNYFWENKLDQIYRFAFSVPVVDRHFMLKTWGKFQWSNPAHVFYFVAAKIDSFFGASGIRWLKYGGEKNKKAMALEFPADHPISIKVVG